MTAQEGMRVKKTKLKKDISFGVVPVCFEGHRPRYLLVQHLAGHWGFPKGHAKKGETAMETACREAEEETGLRPLEMLAEPEFMEVYKVKKKGKIKHKSVTYFIGFMQERDVRVQVSEIKDYAWLSYAKARGRITYKGGREVLKEAHERVRSLRAPNSGALWPKVTVRDVF